MISGVRFLNVSTAKSL